MIFKYKKKKDGNVKIQDYRSYQVNYSSTGELCSDFCIKCQHLYDNCFVVNI